MSEKVAQITGACGEIGQALVQELARQGNYRIVTMDLAPLATSIGSLSSEHIQGDLLGKIKYLYDIPIDEIYHLAAFLSSKAELMPEEAHHVNVDGTLQLLQLAAYKSEKRHQAGKLFFPSSIHSCGSCAAIKRSGLIRIIAKR